MIQAKNLDHFKNKTIKKGNQADINNQLSNVKNPNNSGSNTLKK